VTKKEGLARDLAQLVDGKTSFKTLFKSSNEKQTYGMDL
jgi:hypothetical protein